MQVFPEEASQAKATSAAAVIQSDIDYANSELRLLKLHK